MTNLHQLSMIPSDLSSQYDQSASADGVLEMRALCRHQATVLGISGCISAKNAGSVSAYAARCASVGNALLLDLSGVSSFPAQAMSLLFAVDDACGLAEVPWVVVPSHAVEQALCVAGCSGVVATASSVDEALRHLAHLARVRRCVPLGPGPGSASRWTAAVSVATAGVGS